MPYLAPRSTVRDDKASPRRFRSPSCYETAAQKKGIAIREGLYHEERAPLKTSLFFPPRQGQGE